MAWNVLSSIFDPKNYLPIRFGGYDTAPTTPNTEDSSDEDTSATSVSNHDAAGAVSDGSSSAGTTTSSNVSTSILGSGASSSSIDPHNSGIAESESSGIDVDCLKLTHLETTDADTPSIQDVLYVLIGIDSCLGKELTRAENELLLEEFKSLNENGKCPFLGEEFLDSVHESMATTMAATEDFEDVFTKQQYEMQTRDLLQESFMHHLKATYSLSEGEIARLHELAYYASNHPGKAHIANFGQVHLFDQGLSHVAELVNLVVSERPAEEIIDTTPGSYTKSEYQASEAFSRLSENDYLFSLAPDDGSFEYVDTPDLLTKEFYLDLQNMQDVLQTLHKQTDEASTTITKDELANKLESLKKSDSEFDLSFLITRFRQLSNTTETATTKDTVLEAMLKKENAQALEQAFYETVDNWAEKVYEISSFDDGETLLDYYVWNLSSAAEKHTTENYGKINRHKLGLEHYFMALGQALQDAFRRDPSLEKPTPSDDSFNAYDINKDQNGSPRNITSITLDLNHDLKQMPILYHSNAKTTEATIASMQSQIIQMDIALEDFSARSHFDSRPKSADLLQGIKSFDAIVPGFSGEVLENFSKYTGLDLDVAHLFVTHPDYHKQFIQAYHDKIDGWVFTTYDLSHEEFRLLDYNLYKQKMEYGNALDRIEGEKDTEYGRHHRHLDGPMAFFIALEKTLKSIDRFSIPLSSDDEENGSMSEVN